MILAIVLLTLVIVSFSFLLVLALKDGEVGAATLLTIAIIILGAADRITSEIYRDSKLEIRDIGTEVAKVVHYNNGSLNIIVLEDTVFIDSLKEYIYTDSAIVTIKAKYHSDGSEAYRYYKISR